MDSNILRAIPPLMAVFTLFGTALGSNVGLRHQPPSTRPLLVFEIDEGFPDGLLGKYRSDPVSLKKALGNIEAALRPLKSQYQVAVLLYPCQAYRGVTQGDHPIDRIEPALKQVMGFCSDHSLGVILEAYSSGIETEQNGQIDRRPRAVLGIRAGDRPRPGFAMDLATLDALKQAYPNAFWGIRFHEVYGSDAVWHAQPEGKKAGFTVDPEVIRGCVDFCQRQRMRLIWSDSAWLLRTSPVQGPNFVFSQTNLPYLLAEPYVTIQKEAQRKLGNALCLSWANNNYHFTPNLDFVDSKIGPSTSSPARPIPSWLYFDMPFASSPIKHMTPAVWGMSIQSWFWHEMTNTLMGHYYPGGELDCPVEVLQAFVQKGLKEGASVLQFEPSSYFFNEGLVGKPGYTGAYEQTADHSGRLALSHLEETLLGREAVTSNLGDLFDRDQQRFHENDQKNPPRNFSKSSLWIGKKAFDFLSNGVKWSQSKLSSLRPNVLLGAQSAFRIETQGDGVDEIVAVRSDADHLHLSFYNQGSGLLGEALTIPKKTPNGEVVGVTSANLIAQVVGQGDPDEIVVARRSPESKQVSLEVYAINWVSADGLSFRYEPLTEETNRRVLSAFISPGGPKADGFCGLVGLRTNSWLFSDGTRRLDTLAWGNRTPSGSLISIGKNEAKVSIEAPLKALCALDADLTGTDQIAVLVGNDVLVYGDSPSGWKQTIRKPAPRSDQWMFSVRSRILLNARKP